jgi:MoxR-like ATPase
MIEKSPQETAQWLDALLRSPHRLPAMLWGPPGVGKSSLVAQAADRAGLSCIQLELAVLPPQELLGLPYVEAGESCYARPTFWPTEGHGLIILEDLPHALPAVQAMGMSLILEGRVGPHVLPAGWRVMGTGNRVKDGAGAFRMPTSTASRMVHISVGADAAVWREWALGQRLHEDILGLLGLRPELLHRLDRDKVAWPSPRTWEMASHLHEAGLDIAAAVGEGAAAELQAYAELKHALPALEPILAGEGAAVDWPDELSLRWALVVGLAFKVEEEDQVRNAFQFLQSGAGLEWQSVFLQDTVARFRAGGRLLVLAGLMTQVPELSDFVDGLLEIVA